MCSIMSDETPNHGNLINFIASTVETMRDQMATKSDVARLEHQITAVRGDIEQVHMRIDSIDRTLKARLDEMEGAAPQRRLPAR
jgi:peptidoglycan hydrolase CwlO-like protein